MNILKAKLRGRLRGALKPISLSELEKILKVERNFVL